MATDNNDKNKDRKEEEYVRQTGSLKERLGRVKKTRWWRFGIVALIYVLWTIWMGNPLLLLGLVLLGFRRRRIGDGAREYIEFFCHSLICLF